MSDLDLPALALAFAAGALAGAAYLALLWRSVGRLAQARQPVRALVSGMALRLSLLLGAFYLLMAGDPLRLLAALAGFILVRIAVTRAVGRPRPTAEPARNAAIDPAGS